MGGTAETASELPLSLTAPVIGFLAEALWALCSFRRRGGEAPSNLLGFVVGFVGFVGRISLGCYERVASGAHGMR